MGKWLSRLLNAEIFSGARATGLAAMLVTFDLVADGPESSSTAQTTIRLMVMWAAIDLTGHAVLLHLYWQHSCACVRNVLNRCYVCAAALPPVPGSGHVPIQIAAIAQPLVLAPLQRAVVVLGVGLFELVA